MTVVWALTWLLQSTALAALTAAFVRMPGCRASAVARHAAWTLALFLCVGLLGWPLLSAATAAPAPGSVLGAAGAQAGASISFLVVPSPVIRMSRWLGWAWAIGAAAGLLWTARDVWRVVRLKRRTEPLTDEEQARLGAGLSAWTTRGVPRLAWCDELDAPAVLGFSRPVIALPRSQVRSLPHAQSRLVVLHELAHVRRLDDWWALAERIVVAVTWLNPVVHMMQRELSASREMACDEWVVRQTAAPVAYARCLADVAALRTQARRLRLAAGVAGRPGTLRRRIVGVLALDGRPATRAVAIGAWLAPVAVCVVAAGLLQLPPVVVVAHPPEASATAPAWSRPAETATRVSVEQPAAQPDAAGPPVSAQGARSPRRSWDDPDIPAGPAVNLESATPAPAAPDVAAEQAEAGVTQPLSASPLRGAGEPGVTAAAAVPETFPFHAGAARWWSGPAAIGEATGGAAATAGRATASFVARAGSLVPQLLKR